MTGFGAAEAAVGGRRARVEIRTVNHRYFNLAVRVPGEMAAAEAEMRDALRREFERGHLNVQVRWIDDPAESVSVDVERAGAVVTALQALRERFNLSGEVTVELVARQADVFGLRNSSPESAAVAWSELAPVVIAACADCRSARQREGDVLAAEIAARLTSLEMVAARVAELAPGRLVRERTRLGASVALLLDGRTVDESRLMAELAIIADRLDITEELVRLRSHLSAAREALGREQPVGKQLGFLAQEMGREVNTIGSKANDAVIALEVVTMKGELEKVREQLENIE
jgi:uncharacterized protein (TIGR00255 family)